MNDRFGHIVGDVVLKMQQIL
ncbi:hypothetical protein PL321_02320 [Caloramator sp. mosi_1]|nr:hypothetical protein [Caloramator sp. mosi_1]WDC85559.1 hypothetical protein PL321_02320 [Caloramator sp. mosi_1]